MKHYISNSSLDQPLSSDFVIDPLWTSALPDDADPSFSGAADGDGALAENPADVADIIADPSRFPEIMKARQEQHAAAAEAYRAAVTTLAPPARSAADLMPALALEAAEHAAAARAYPRILAADAARRTKAAKGVAIRAITRIKSGASRAGHARAVHAHVSHGGARASPGDGGGSSADGPSGERDGPPRREPKLFVSITADVVEVCVHPNPRGCTLTVIGLGYCEFSEAIMFSAPRKTIRIGDTLRLRGRPSPSRWTVGEVRLKVEPEDVILVPTTSAFEGVERGIPAEYQVVRTIIADQAVQERRPPPGYRLVRTIIADEAVQERRANGCRTGAP